MAMLVAKTGGGSLLLTPFGGGTGPAAAALTQVELAEGGRAVVSATVRLTADDFGVLRAALRDFERDDSDAVRVANANETFVFEARHAGLAGDVAVAVWVGDPARVMKGGRFIVTARELAFFLGALEIEPLYLKLRGA